MLALGCLTKKWQALQQDPANHPVNSPLQPEEKWVVEIGYLEEMEDIEAGGRSCTDIVGESPEGINYF